MTMTHPGLTTPWLWLSLAGMLLAALSLWRPAVGTARRWSLALDGLPVLGGILRLCRRSPWPLQVSRLAVAAVFLLVIIAGLYGTALPERNLATSLTWTIWWTGVIIAVFFLGSSWCAVCPWDALAGWLVRRKLWRRAENPTSLALQVPKCWRNVWPALLMFVGLTWLELGVGVTTNPYATALLALLMLVLATAGMAVFEGKAFCHYVCPVGRTIGFYNQLAMTALRPRDVQTCADCKTLDCYHGSKDIEACPTHLVMGRLTQSTYCTSCGNCVMSCPHDNVGWRLRSPASEAIHDARPHWDEAWFMLGLLALTSFHGITMMPFWESGLSRFAQWLGDSGQLLWSFSLGMLVILLLPAVLYALLLRVTQWLLPVSVSFRALFTQLAFISLPLAFSYHIAHNLTHLLRESRGFTAVMLNPLGRDTLPLGMQEMHLRHLQPLLPASIQYGLQAAIMVFGFWLAVRVLRRRASELVPTAGSLYLLPGLVFIMVMSGFNLWLLAQPMVMRM